ncbi:hypothetical protein N7474_001106 [Penicillium riverlandense]|uniref:uncharacterized protein n=1 Tax=Penicillium riverlandense TaxID=1903569 RepID=UPI00254866F7|nr:uncharacterized protein N7474_001106 [Penicillium riverlandense]KAJ5832795.1 hypothetical protein N7474_001106 [Penicillium riverlandense]
MSSSDHPESGVSANPSNEHELGPTTSPQTLQPQAPPTQGTSASVPAVSGPVADTPASTAQADGNDRPGDANHPATTGGESVAPVTATTTTQTTSTPPTNADALQPSDAPSMAVQEPKPAVDLSSDPSDDVEEPKEVEEDAGPSLAITLLLTTGSRHPFTIDGKYLRKRSVNVENYDPFAMSVYTLKELIWREWRSDWETRPSSPSFIRLISFGKLLDDKSPLTDLKFSRDAPNVVHMTVKPQEMVEEEDAKGAKAQYSREREASERSPGCRCVIL